MTIKTRNNSLFDFQGRPPIYKALPISLQHVLAMIAGVITPPRSSLPVWWGRPPRRSCC